MRQKTAPVKQLAEDVIRDIRRATRRHFSTEENIRIVLCGVPGEESIAEIYGPEGILPRCIAACPRSSVRSASIA